MSILLQSFALCNILLPHRGLWLPGHSLEDEPSVTAETLLGSSFAQELYITVPAAQLFHNPGIYTLQVSLGHRV